MDISKIEEARDFNGPGRGYIHAEMKDGEREIFITGNAAVLIFGIGMICDGIAKNTGQSFETILKAVKESYYITRTERDKEDPGIYKEI